MNDNITTILVITACILLIISWKYILAIIFTVFSLMFCALAFVFVGIPIMIYETLSKIIKKSK